MAVAITAQRVRALALSALPTGTPLPGAVWAARHQVIVLIVWAHAVAIATYGVAVSVRPWHVLAEAAVLATFALAAKNQRLARDARATAAVFGLLTCSALLVHLSGGLIEMHFHFFVMVALVTLYQRWMPFLIAVAFVVVHHGTLGVLAPDAVYSHASAQANPWLWAGIHGLFIIGASLAGLTNWRLDELMRAQAVRAERDMTRESAARQAAEREVGARRALEHELRRRADYDQLTGLPNRGHFVHKLTEAHARPGRTHGLAVLFLDIDRFKVINDSLGHRAGDVLICQVGERLSRSVRPDDTAARLGGDEFTVLIEDTPDVESAVTMAERILAVMAEPFSVDGREVASGVSIGIAFLSPDDPALTPDELLRRADVALYQAKGNGRGRVALYDPMMDAMTPERVERETALHHAIARNELVVHYQPIVRLADRTLWGFEALIRWQHAQLGLVLPSTFIPAAEETGLIVPLGRWVLQNACRQLASWRETEPWGDDIRLSVNVSALELRQPDYVEYVSRTLRELNLPASALILEITESALMDDTADTRCVVRGLHEHGVSLAVDDFGTGYSSLGYVQRFPASVLKIDRSFVTGSAEDEGGAMMLRAATAVGRALGIRVAAEGIEHEGELPLLLDLGCELGQGYLLGQPASPAHVQRELQRGRVELPRDPCTTSNALEQWIA